MRLYELEVAGAFFVVRAKNNLKFRAIESRKVDKSTGLRCGQSIRLTVAKSSRNYPDKIRRIKYYDAEKDIGLVFLTHDFELDAIQIASIYKSRWQIEVFFKWIKQHLEIKTLWGHSENAVITELWIAISTYLIVAYLKHQI